jgi:hypothetical protein
MITENSIFACIVAEQLWVGHIIKHSDGVGFYIYWNDGEGRHGEPVYSITLNQLEKNFNTYSSIDNHSGAILSSEQELLAYKLKWSSK